MGSSEAYTFCIHWCYISTWLPCSKKKNIAFHKRVWLFNITAIRLHQFWFSSSLFWVNNCCNCNGVTCYKFPITINYHGKSWSCSLLHELSVMVFDLVLWPARSHKKHKRASYVFMKFCWYVIIVFC